ncbi:MAG: hypothetical protein GF334_05170 [Candidatus Altiarchaeales archaeon]|nr:hypothetical protein [Candidatus Altiarchaeales archaeon]
MADLSNFTSSGTTYDFSKGPKSIYYAQGDEDLFGIILNVPQTDDDDEWGGTERIALERISDKLGDLQKSVEDPYGSGTNGLLNRVTALEGIVDTSTPKVTLGNVTINGSTDQITIGSGMTLTSSGLTLGDFSLSLANPTSYLIDFKDVSLYMTDTGATKQFQISVGSTSYIFTETQLTLSQLNLSGDLTVTGDITGTNIQATGNIHGATVCGDDLSTFNNMKIQGDFQNNIVPRSSSTYNIGTPALRWNGIAGTSLNISGASTLTGTITATDIDISGTATVSGTIDSDLVPSVTATYDLGSTSARWQGIAGVALNLSGNITATDLNVNDINCRDILMRDLIANDVTICGSNITIDGAAMASNASIAVTGANITSTQLVQGAVLGTTSYVSLSTTTEPAAPTAQAFLYYRTGAGSDTSVFLKVPGGTVFEIKSV